MMAELYGPVCTERYIRSSPGTLHPFFLGAKTKTNQSAELTGLAEALLFFKFFSDREALTIYSDSQWAINVALGMSKAQEHTALATSVTTLAREMTHRVKFVWVPSHSGHKWNEAADKLADLGMMKCCTVGRYGANEPLRNGFLQDLPSADTTSPTPRIRLPSHPAHYTAPPSQTQRKGHTSVICLDALSDDDSEASHALPPPASCTDTEFIDTCRRLGPPTKAALLASRWAIPVSEMQRAVDIVEGGRSSEVLITKFGIDITRNLFCCLKLKKGTQLIKGRPDNWLNDEVVNFYGRMLDERDCTRNQVDPSVHRTIIFSSFFLVKLLETDKAYTFANVKRWTKKIPDVRALKAILLPIFRDDHWTAAIIRMKTRRMDYHDSRGGSGEWTLAALWRWLNDEHEAKGLPPPIKEEWTFDPTAPTPIQSNGVDCGVFATMVMDRLAEDLPLDFAQENIPDLRRKMATDILRGHFVYPFCGSDTAQPPRDVTQGERLPSPTPPTPTPASSTPQTGGHPLVGSRRGALLVGAKVRKDFPTKETGEMRPFTGVVTGYRPKYYRNRYEDGDEEEMEWKLLGPILIAEDPPATPSTEGYPTELPPPAAQPAASTSPSSLDPLRVE